MASWGEVATAYGAKLGESPTRVAKSQIGRKLATLWRMCVPNRYLPKYAGNHANAVLYPIVHKCVSHCVLNSCPVAACAHMWVPYGATRACHMCAKRVWYHMVHTCMCALVTRMGTHVYTLVTRMGQIGTYLNMREITLMRFCIQLCTNACHIVS